MKRILLIATLIFISCALAPARDSGGRAGDNPHVETNTTPRLVVNGSAGVNDDK
jgi:hypothetical protein